MSKIALIVHACDRYQLLFDGFYHFFKQNGGLDIPFKKYFLTENIDIHYEGFENIKTGTGEWSNRLLTALAQIPESHVLYFQEDMWLCKPISKSFFEEIDQFIASKNIKLLKLHSSEVYDTEGCGIYFQGLQLAQLNKEKSEYLMSHQVSVWEKKFLAAQLSPDEHPWRNERKATKRLRRSSEILYQIDYFAENNKPSINKNASESVRSAYYAVSANSRLYETVRPFIDILLKQNLTRMYGEKLQNHLENDLTHDGKAVPHKEDFFKKWRIKIGELFFKKEKY